MNDIRKMVSYGLAFACGLVILASLLGRALDGVLFGRRRRRLW